jgi:hypothetical protein
MAFGEVEVGVADTGGRDPDEDLSRLRGIEEDVLDRERRADLVEHGRADAEWLRHRDRVGSGWFLTLAIGSCEFSQCRDGMDTISAYRVATGTIR